MTKARLKWKYTDLGTYETQFSDRLWGTVYVKEVFQDWLPLLPISDHMLEAKTNVAKSVRLDIFSRLTLEQLWDIRIT